MLRSVGGEQFVHSMEVISFSESPLLEVPLYQQIFIIIHAMETKLSVCTKEKENCCIYWVTIAGSNSR